MMDVDVVTLQYGLFPGENKYSLITVLAVRKPDKNSTHYKHCYSGCSSIIVLR